MKVYGKYRLVVINTFIAVAISLIINFSYILAIFESNNNAARESGRWEERPAFVRKGILAIQPDGYGYMLALSPQQQAPEDSISARMVGIDTVFVHQNLIRRLDLQNRDTLKISILPPHMPGAHFIMKELVELNGEPFDYRTLFNRPSDELMFSLQLIYYFLMAFILISIITAKAQMNNSMKIFMKRVFYCLVVGVILYCMAPVIQWRGRGGDIVMNIAGDRRLDGILILKFSFTFVVAVLYGRLYELIYQKQAMLIENEQLKNENLLTRYNILVSQINPHFLFNSLNSLSMLVREKQEQKALTYIDQLSYTFRYIIQNGQNMMTSLSDEMKFLEAYKYLLEIRYADKLFFDIEVDESRYGSWLLPSLSLQPLIENAVKHNSITRAKPLRISIRTEGATLVVSNPLRPKMEAEHGTGIGLRNLNSRWSLLTGQEMEVRQSAESFSVALPLTPPAAAKTPREEAARA
ncbi:MAG: histidine kinase [Rikenellaceae bacterium]|nr:histidine kinase [Rikenellaceae bacterium]